MTVARCQSMAAFYMPSSPLWTTQTSPTSSSCQRPVRLTSGSSWRWLTRTAGKYNLVTSVQVPPQLWLRLQTRDKECNSIPGLPRSQDDYLLPGLAALLAVFPGAGVPQPPGHQVTVIRHQVSDTITGSLSLSRIPGSASASWPAQRALLPSEPGTLTVTKLKTQVWKYVVDNCRGITIKDDFNWSLNIWPPLTLFKGSKNKEKLRILWILSFQNHLEIMESIKKINFAII